MVSPQEVPELVIWERLPSTLRNIDDGPSGGVGAGDPGAPPINAKKRRRRPPEVPKLKIRERPPSTLGNVNSGPPGGVGAADSEAPTINAKKHQQWAPGNCWS
jgi:hypothetical protein